MLKLREGWVAGRAFHDEVRVAPITRQAFAPELPERRLLGGTQVGPTKWLPVNFPFWAYSAARGATRVHAPVAALHE